MKSFDIMYSDLNSEAQKRYLTFQGVESADELNWEVLPLATIDSEPEGEVDEGFCGDDPRKPVEGPDKG